MEPLQHVRIIRGRWERPRYGTTHYAGDELIVTASEAEFLGDQAETLEYIDPEPFDTGTDATYTHSWLADRSHERLKSIFYEVGGDPDTVDLRSSEAVIDEILTIQSEAGG